MTILTAVCVVLRYMYDVRQQTASLLLLLLREVYILTRSLVWVE